MRPCIFPVILFTVAYINNSSNGVAPLTQIACDEFSHRFSQCVICPGQAEMYRMMESKVDEMMKKSQSPRRRCEDNIRPPELPPPPTFNWNGIFPHVCRQAGDECNRRAKPFPMIPCNPGCKHWTVPRPCTYPICRANCYEDPPPRPPKRDLPALALEIVPYLKQDTC